MNNHKATCGINIRCAVYHSDGICDHPTYGKCTCGLESTPPAPARQELGKILGAAIDKEFGLDHGPHWETKTEGGGWRERFDREWAHLVDWAGSGFRYNDPSFTSEGLKVMKPRFTALLEAELKAAEERVRRELAIEVEHLQKDFEPWDGTPQDAWGQAFKSVLALLRGSGGGTNV